MSVPDKSLDGGGSVSLLESQEKSDPSCELVFKKHQSFKISVKCDY